jgi:hypothetical protein
MTNFIRCLALASCVFCSCFASAASGQDTKLPDAKLPPKEQFHLFLLVGQSNMAGRGKVAEEDKRPHPRVLMLTKDNTWAPAVEPLHFDKPGAGVGPGRAFGVAIAEGDPKITVGLIPCAAGGSPIAAWTPGGYHGQTKSHPYDDALTRAKAALASGTLKGILWHQGESDAGSADKAKIYGEKLHELIARFRRELNAPQAPFIAGQLGQFPREKWSEGHKQVNAVHEGLPKAVPHTAFVSSDGLGHKGDNLHFSAEGAREFGLRYAKAYRDLTGKAGKPQ